VCRPTRKGRFFRFATHLNFDPGFSRDASENMLKLEIQIALVGQNTCSSTLAVQDVYDEEEVGVRSNLSKHNVPHFRASHSQCWICIESYALVKVDVHLNNSIQAQQTNSSSAYTETETGVHFRQNRSTPIQN